MTQQARITIGIPSRGMVHMAWSLAFSALQWPVNETRSTVVTLGEEVATARNNIVKAAQDKESDYLVFIDDDTTLPNTAPRRLIYLMEQNPDWDMVTGVYVTKTAPPEPLIFGGEVGSAGAFWDWRCGEIFPIWGAGLGAAVIRMSSFDKLEEPWFLWEESNDGLNTSSEGEDLYFCRKLKEAGGTIMADGATLCGHIDTKTGTMYRLWKDSLPYKNALPEFLADPLSGQVGDKPDLEMRSKGARPKKQKAFSGIVGK